MHHPPLADVAVIGGSGFYHLLDDVEELTVRTPYGEPSGQVSVGTVDGRSIAFLPRHGPDHRFPAHRIPYRANAWALAKIGVRRILAPCAVGSLRAELGPGAFVLPDQVIDRTTARERSFNDEGAAHISFSDPYCPTGADVVEQAAVGLGRAVVRGGTMVVIDGPRFSTRAESRHFADIGGTVINMTGMPEAVLARELGMCYAPLCLVTDRDAGIGADDAVTQEAVFAAFAENIEVMRVLVTSAVARLPWQGDGCRCPHEGILTAA